MNVQELNKRKNELLDQQERVLNAAQEAKRKFTDAEETNFKAWEAEIAEISTTVARFEAINKSRGAILQPTTQIEAPVSVKAIEARNAKTKKFSTEYHDAFYGNFQNIVTGRTNHFQNTNLTEGSNADGGYLVPISVDSEIVPLAPNETALRQLCKVIPTSMDIKLPAQLTKTVAALRTETNAFAGTPPTFTQVTLSAFFGAVKVPISLELAQDVPALTEFLNQDIADGIDVYEDDKFVNGSGSGEPQGVLAGGTDALSEALTGDNALDLVGKLNPRYYRNAAWLMNRSTGITVRKKQISDNQFLPYWTNVNGKDFFHGFPVSYSAAMPVYSASPAVTGKAVFGDFKAGMVIGDRGGSGISVKVLDQTSILNGILDVIGYRRTDSRVRVAQALQVWSITG